MKYVISTKALRDRGIKEEEALAVLLLTACDNISELFERLIKKGYIRRTEGIFGQGFEINETFLNKVQAALLSKDPDVPEEDKLDTLASQLMEVFPKGKKEGTTSYWRGNRKEIRERLQKFFKLYGNKYTDEQILKATQDYVSSFNGNYSYMRVLKYFILKDERKSDEDGKLIVQQVSDLATFIENAEDLDPVRNDWTSNLI